MVNGYKTYRALLGSIALAIGLVAMTPSISFAQEGLPEFEVDAVSMRSDTPSSKTRVDLYTRIPYSNLTFITSSLGFQAAYEVTVEVYSLDDRDHRQSLIHTSTWESKQTVDLFRLTQSPGHFNHTTHSMDLDPGRYVLEFEVTDQNSQAGYVQEQLIEVRDLNKTVALSNILLLDDYDAESQTIYPRVSPFVGSDDYSFQTFYELYTDRVQDIQITREVLPMRKHRTTMQTILGIGPDETEEIVALYTDSQPVTLAPGRHQTITEIPMEALKVDKYVLRIRVEDMNGQLLDEVEKPFVSHWTGLDAHLTDLAEAINQMEYIAKPRELREMRDANNQDEQWVRFQEFWKKHDPTPNTLRNEKMEEYYYRIQSANTKYGNVTPGWKTDRGHVLIKFGEPDHVQSYPFNYDSQPYEVWTYYRISRRFLFIDKTGFGDFELEIPIWDDRNRIR